MSIEEIAAKGVLGLQEQSPKFKLDIDPMSDIDPIVDIDAVPLPDEEDDVPISTDGLLLDEDFDDAPLLDNEEEEDNQNDGDLISDGMIGQDDYTAGSVIIKVGSTSSSQQLSLIHI